MSDDVSSNRFLWVSGKHGGSVDLSNHLVRDDHTHSKLDTQGEGEGGREGGREGERGVERERDKERERESCALCGC